ncbi:hypothetical protein EJB05_46222 [Eragrostis curvula]|uniref:Uncharacterized protein n=1 Tax=Eragrostis curvula TaxID=38414 RepID=A0A5J9TPK1_9POAL|nr:hypothetical protein EJB05_46222 [Eragrostis curvula]
MPRPAGRQLALVAAGFWSPMDEMLWSRHQARITSFLFACSHTPTDACCWGGYHLFSRRSPPSFSPDTTRSMRSKFVGTSVDITEASDYPPNFVAFKDFNNITPETMLLLCGRKERHNLSSDFRTCFEALPANFNTSWALRVPSTGWNQHWQLHLRVSHVGFFSFILPVHFIRYNISLLQKIGLDEAEVPSHCFSDDD